MRDVYTFKYENANINGIPMACALMRAKWNIWTWRIFQDHEQQAVLGARAEKFRFQIIHFNYTFLHNCFSVRTQLRER